MTDFSQKLVAATIKNDVNISANKINKSNKMSYWKQMLKNYEKRNASLERKRSALVERIRFMECTLPSLLVGAAASAAYSKRKIFDEQSRILENMSKSTAQKTQ